MQKEVIFIRKHKEKIMKNAQILYKQKANNDTTAKYVKTALDFKLLESLCDQFDE